MRTISVTLKRKQPRNPQICLISNVLFIRPFTTAFRILKHQIDHHTINRRFLCGLCTKDYATKYLHCQHFAQVHLGLKYKCGFAGCGKWFKIKRTRDTHESSHQMCVSTDSKVNFVCERCNQMFDALDKLKIHKLTHSKTKKYVCRVCKQHGYTRASDRSNHEVKCCDDHKCEIVDGIVVPLPPLIIYLYLLHHQNLQTLLTKDPRLGLKKFFFC